MVRNPYANLLRMYKALKGNRDYNENTATL